MLFTAGKPKYPPDPIDSYDGYFPKTDKYPPKEDTYPPEDDKYPVPDDKYTPPGYDKPPVDYKPPGDYDYKPPGGYDYKPPSDYKPDYKPPGDYQIYPPYVAPAPECSKNNICEKRGYKCCACVDCTSDSFGCAETCACCPRVRASFYPF